MPDFVLERIHDIMKENNMTDVSRVGLYGLTYKENVDDNGQNHVSIYRDGVKQKCYIREYELLEYKVTVCAEEAVFDSDIIKIKL